MALDIFVWSYNVFHDYEICSMIIGHVLYSCEPLWSQTMDIAWGPAPSVGPSAFPMWESWGAGAAVGAAASTGEQHALRIGGPIIDRWPLANYPTLIVIGSQGPSCPRACQGPRACRCQLA